jgi:hypothetical protein
MNSILMVAMLGVKYILIAYMKKQIHGFGMKRKASLSFILLENLNPYTLNKRLSMFMLLSFISYYILFCVSK